MAEPGTRPPPVTRSSSRNLVVYRLMICSSPSKVSKVTLERLRLEALWPATAMGSALSSTIEFHSPHAEHFPAHCEVTLPHFWQIYVAFLGMVWVSLFCASDDFFEWPSGCPPETGPKVSALFFSHGLFRSYRCGPSEGRRNAPDAPGVMSLNPKRAELLIRIVCFSI